MCQLLRLKSTTPQGSRKVEGGLQKKNSKLRPVAMAGASRHALRPTRAARLHHRARRRTPPLQQLRFSRRFSSAGRIRVHAQTQWELDINSPSRGAFFFLGRSHQTSGVCGNRACAASRPLGQVWRPWRCAAACRNATSRRAWGVRQASMHPWAGGSPSCAIGHVPGEI